MFHWLFSIDFWSFTWLCVMPKYPTVSSLIVYLSLCYAQISHCFSLIVYLILCYTQISHCFFFDRLLCQTAVIFLKFIRTLNVCQRGIYPYHIGVLSNYVVVYYTSFVTIAYVIQLWSSSLLLSLCIPWLFVVVFLYLLDYEPVCCLTKVFAIVGVSG